MKSQKVLLVLPEASRREGLARILGEPGPDTLLVGSAAAAAQALTAGFDILVIDLSLTDLDIAALRRALSPSLEEPDSLDAAERRHLALVLRHTAGNKRKAAHILGISRSTLLNKVRKYRLEAAR